MAHWLKTHCRLSRADYVLMFGVACLSAVTGILSKFTQIVFLFGAAGGPPNLLYFHYSGYYRFEGLWFCYSDLERRNVSHMDYHLFSQSFLLGPFQASHQRHIKEDYHLLLDRGSSYDAFLGHADQLHYNSLSSSWAR